MKQSSPTLNGGSNEDGTEAVETVECRPNGVMWVVAGAGFVVGTALCIAPAVVLSARRDLDAALMMAALGVFGVLFLGLGLYGLLFQCRARVLADPHQLRWRGIRGWRSAYWEQVRDYYERSFDKDSSFITIETAAGRVAIGPAGWTRVDALKAVVQARANRARAATWGNLGCRPEDDWPRIFRYDAESNRRSLWGMCGLIAALLAVPIVMAVSRGIDRVWSPGWQWSVAAFGLLEMMFLLYSLVPLSTARGYLDALGRQNERVIAERDGLTFEDGRRRVRVAWRDVQGWQRSVPTGLWALRGRYKVQTAAGDFEFTRWLQEAPVLVALITLRLGRKPESDEDDDGLDAPSRTAADEHVYTYRTRTNRALALLPTSIAIIFSLVPFLIRLVIPPEQPQTPGRSMLQIVLVACLWSGALVAWIYYFRPCIEIDSDGITQRTLFGKKRLEWTEVESYALHPEGFDGHGEIVGSSVRLRFGLMIAHIEPLKADIARRAVNSRTHGWETPFVAPSHSPREGGE